MEIARKMVQLINGYMAKNVMGVYPMSDSGDSIFDEYMPDSELVKLKIEKVYGRTSATVNFYYRKILGIPKTLDPETRTTWSNIHHRHFHEGRQNIRKWRRLGRLLAAANLIKYDDIYVLRNFSE